MFSKTNCGKGKFLAPNNWLQICFSAPITLALKKKVYFLLKDTRPNKLTQGEIMLLIQTTILLNCKNVVFINRPGVAGAVPQTPSSLINSLIN